ncbi:CvpA family protein [Furfurilactobacillus curtus]|uniref:Colicin V biosynthesis protein n=1 Tax=Furfurilactobacillus curtus TaxID=1746200 RepID=A0ABQ5JRW9_9LACO
MILSLIVIFLLLSALGRGYRRGFVAELVSTIGYLVVLIVAKILTPSVSAMIQTWLPTNHQHSVNDQLLSTQVNHFWASGIAFWGLLIVGFVLLHFVMRSLNLFTHLPVIHGINAFAGAIIAGCLMYGLIFFGLAVASVWPSAWLHQQIATAPICQWILHQTPLLSEQIYQWWLTR